MCFGCLLAHPLLTLGVGCLISLAAGVSLATLADRYPARARQFELTGGVFIVGGLVMLGVGLQLLLGATASGH